jgi:hypothetical protein
MQVFFFVRAPSCFFGTRVTLLGLGWEGGQDSSGDGPGNWGGHVSIYSLWTFSEQK